MTWFVLALLVSPLGCEDPPAKPFLPQGPPPKNTIPTDKDSGPGDGTTADKAVGEAGAEAGAEAGTADVGVDSSGGCTMDCDCKQGETCVSGKCVVQTVQTYCCNLPACPLGQKCTDLNNLSGFCGTTGTCVKQCECDQGLTCQNGICQKLSTPAYCCSKPGCPSGKPCIATDGSSGTCK